MFVRFDTGAADTLINGIEGSPPGGTRTLAIDCGSFAGGAITISPATFVDQGAIRVANDGSVAITGLTGNLGQQAPIGEPAA